MGKGSPSVMPLAGYESKLSASRTVTLVESKLEFLVLYSKTLHTVVFPLSVENVLGLF